MQFIDTHSHLYLEEFDSDRDEVIRKAIIAGVNRILLPNIDSASVENMLNMVSKYSGICYPMIGIHPTSVKADYAEQFEKIKEWSGKGNFIAIGEIGIDLYWDKTFFKEQVELFKAQIELAIELSLPVVIHARESFLEIFKELEPYRGSSLRGIFHAFTGDTGEAEHIIDSGFLLGIGGIVTFKNAGLDKVVKDIGIEHLVLETDSPYLAPVPHRGQRNESAYIPLIASKISELTDVPEEKVAELTTANAINLFKLEK